MGLVKTRILCLDIGKYSLRFGHFHLSLHLERDHRLSSIKPPDILLRTGYRFHSCSSFLDQAGFRTKFLGTRQYLGVPVQLPSRPGFDSASLTKCTHSLKEWTAHITEMCAVRETAHQKMEGSPLRHGLRKPGGGLRL